MLEKLNKNILERLLVDGLFKIDNLEIFYRDLMINI
jgi:hypothetical protein